MQTARLIYASWRLTNDVARTCLFWLSHFRVWGGVKGSHRSGGGGGLLTILSSVVSTLVRQG